LSLSGLDRLEFEPGDEQGVNDLAGLVASHHDRSPSAGYVSNVRAMGNPHAGAVGNVNHKGTERLGLNGVAGM
jgi:hypothetical protein